MHIRQEKVMEEKKSEKEKGYSEIWVFLRLYLPIESTKRWRWIFDEVGQRECERTECWQ